MPQYLHELGSIILTTECYIVSQNKILMHRRSENKGKFPCWWSLPGGHIDEGEDTLIAVVREVQEETGIKLLPSQLKLKYQATHHHLDRREIYVAFGFRADIDTVQGLRQTEEGLNKWIGIEKAFTLDKVFEPIKYYFMHVLRDEPGILYNSSQWENTQLVKVLSEHIV